MSKRKTTGTGTARPPKKRKTNAKFDPIVLYDMLSDRNEQLAQWTSDDSFRLEYSKKVPGSAPLSQLIGGAKNLSYYGFSKIEGRDDWFHLLVEKDTGKRVFRQHNRDDIGAKIQRAAMKHYEPAGTIIEEKYSAYDPLQYLSITHSSNLVAGMHVNANDGDVLTLRMKINNLEGELNTVKAKLAKKESEVDIWKDQCYALLRKNNDTNGTQQNGLANTGESIALPDAKVSLAPEDNIYECPICCDMTHLNELRGFGCGHHCCRSCLKTYISKQIANRAIPIRCPFPCDHEIQQGEITCHIDPQQYKQYMAAVHDSLVMRSDDLVYCPTPDCDQVVQWDKDRNPRLQCQKCCNTWCLLCKVPWHDGLTCQEYQAFSFPPPLDPEPLDLNIGDGGFVTCACGTWLEYTSGCYVVTCICGRRVCGKCGKVVEPGNTCSHTTW